MTKRNFDLDVAIVVLTIGAMILPRLWATRRVMEGSGGTPAKVVKAITA
jgi:hypothetical protein